jgi:peptidoglycan/xylan/chitin deacetylase (PgdA/CDA1 family)
MPATIFLATDFIGRDHEFWWQKVFSAILSSKHDSVDIRVDSERLHFDLDGRADRRDAAKYVNNILMNKDEKTIEDAVKDMGDSAGNPMLSWEQIKEMKEAGINFGSHTSTHRNLCLLSDKEVLSELKDSKKEIEKALNAEISEFSYPFGLFDERVKGLVKNAGFKCARTLSKGYNTENTDRFVLKAINAGSFLNTSFLAARIASVVAGR